MLRSVVKTLTVLLASSALLTACGGGNNNDSAKTNANNDTTAGTGSSSTNDNSNSSGPLTSTKISGVFDDKNDSSRPLTILLQDDGSYFIVYSDAASAPNASGVVLGTGTLNNGSFSSTNGLGLSLVGIGTQTPSPATVSASYSEKSTFNGSISYTADNKTTSFAGVYNNTFETLPDLASLAGEYTGSIATKDAREDNIVLKISADGTLTGQLTCGCSITAQLEPSANRTAYDAKLEFKEGDNPLTGTTFTGNVYFDTVTKRLYIVGKTNDGGAVFVGTKS